MNRMAHKKERIRFEHHDGYVALSLFFRYKPSGCLFCLMFSRLCWHCFWMDLLDFNWGCVFTRTGCPGSIGQKHDTRELLAGRIMSAGLILIGYIRYGTWVFLSEVKVARLKVVLIAQHSTKSTESPKGGCSCLWNLVFTPWRFLLPVFLTGQMICHVLRLLSAGRRIKHSLPKNIIWYILPTQKRDVIWQKLAFFRKHTPNAETRRFWQKLAFCALHYLCTRDWTLLGLCRRTVPRLPRCLSRKTCLRDFSGCVRKVVMFPMWDTQKARPGQLLLTSTSVYPIYRSIYVAVDDVVGYESFLTLKPIKRSL